MPEQNPSATRETSHAMTEDARQLIAESKKIALRSERHVIEVDELIAASCDAIAESRRRLMRRTPEG